VALAGVLGGLSVAFAGAAISLHTLAEQRFERALSLVALEARVTRSQSLHRQLRLEMGRFQRDPQPNSLMIELDASACELGQWLGGPSRLAAVQQLPSLAGKLDELASAHAALHEAARRVDFRLRTQDRDAAQADLVRYGDPAIDKLSGELEEIVLTVERARERRTDELEAQEDLSVAAITVIAVLAVLGSLGAGLAVVAHRRSALALQLAVDALEQLLAAVPMGIVVVDGRGAIRRANQAAAAMLKCEPEALVGLAWIRFVASAAGEPLPSGPQEVAVLDIKGQAVPVLQAVLPTTLGGERVLVHALVDLSDRQRLENQLRHSQKLEAVGQLASGIAHEINTPAQFVGDSLAFLADSYHDLLVLIATYRTIVARASEADRGLATLAEQDADLNYLVEQTPAALERAKDGMGRITSIVRAMKEFAHPAAPEKQPADLNKALEMTLVIARNEYKYVAEIERSLGPLPAVVCNVDDLNQVFLNLLVNAAHAIGDRVGPEGTRGRITVRTYLEGPAACVEIRDTGCGIPEAIRDRVFEPFFTTKEVGRGTGQGLAIARSIVTEKHGGTLTFESKLGVGTTFFIRLPIDGTTLARPATPAKAA
jgi:signal transduction histidine kinase